MSRLSRIFNINSRELPRVAVSWLLTFFVRLGFVIGWVTLTAMFVAKFGISFLPTLFIVNAIFMILGSLLFTELIPRVKRELLFFLTVIAAAILLFTATFFSANHPYVYFGLLIVAESIFVSQLFILLSVIIEELFSPLESEHAFPTIESAETIGAIVGGSLITLLIPHIDVSQFIFVWILSLLIVIPILLYYQNSVSRQRPVIFKNLPLNEPKQPLRRWKDSVEAIRKIPFLKGLFLIILTQWIFFNMLEFQYTKAVEQQVVQKKEETLAQNQSRIFHVSLLTDPHGVPVSKDVIPGLKAESLTHNEERSLTMLLGQLYMLFGVVALLTQLFFASRFIHAYGIINSFLIHPLLLLLSFIGVFLKFGFISTITMRSTFEIGNVIHKNAYHSSYYALKPGLREQTHEFFDGLVKPLGVICGMTLLLMFHFILHGKMLTVGINMIMGTVLLVMLIETLDLRKKYTELPGSILFSDEEEREKWHAIEILTQKGHENSVPVLMNALEAYRPNESMQIRILRALGKIKSLGALPGILSAFEDKRPNVRLAAVHSLSMFHDLGEIFNKQAFSRYRVIEALKKLFQNENSEEIRTAIIYVFSVLKEPDTVPFLLEVLSNGNIEMKAHCIAVCGHFRDPNTAYYVFPYLNFNHPLVRAHAAAALWRYPGYQEKALDTLQQMIQKGEKSELIPALSVLGEILLPEIKKMLFSYLRHDDKDVVFYAALSLAQMGERIGFVTVADLLPSANDRMFDEFKKIYRRLPKKLRKKFSKMLTLHFAEKFHEYLPRATMERFMHIYDALGYHDLAHEISRVIETVYPFSAAEASGIINRF